MQPVQPAPISALSQGQVQQSQSQQQQQQQQQQQPQYAGDVNKKLEYGNYMNSYGGQPYYAKMGIGAGQGPAVDSKVIEKLNYMIHLLEQQQNEKTGHVMEELILYTFLGVFVIFVVDSFARSGKYVR
jgi:hypothetical protein